MSKQPKSGLGTVKRDWSDSQSSSLTTVEWPPSPPKNTRKLTGAQQRLKDIQDALAGKPVQSEKHAVSGQSISKQPPLSPSHRPGKRPNASVDVNEHPMKKSRQLTPSTQSSQSSTSTAVSSSSTAVSQPTQPVIRQGKVSPKPKEKVSPIFLSSEQKEILEIVKEGHNVFYTGSAGTGKSVLLHEIIATLKRKYIKSPDVVAVTASTGIASCNVGGVTLHSFAGIGVGADCVEDLLKKIRRNKKASTRWLRTKVLIIDEISMIDGDLFDKLSRIGSMMRKRTEPFGGIQLIVTGDFFQLPPVTKGVAKFAFEADLWTSTMQRTFNLTQVFRQRDPTFINMLNEMRFGRLSIQSVTTFKSLSRSIHYEDGLGSTELFPRREDVERANRTRMAQLTGHEEIYVASDGGTLTEPNTREKLLGNFMAPKRLELRIGAQVMLIKNTDEMLVNGSLGTVISFSSQEAHAAQEDEPSDSKKPVSKTSRLYPLVEFPVSGGGKRTMLVQPESWKVELPDGEIQVSRTQLPLIPAWAMSIHKSQGQTLDRVKVDLAKVFEKGQAYVALSRATSLEGLQVLNFDPLKVKAHPKVVDWSKNLEIIAIKTV